MKYKPLVRLLLRLMGIAFIAWSVRDVFMYVVSLVVALFQKNGFANGLPVWLMLLLQTLYPAIELLIGLYLLFGGQWILDCLLPPDARYCPVCSGQVGLSDIICCDCGADLPAKSANVD